MLFFEAMPPSCCRCNGNGKYLNCACVKVGQQCTNFLPKRRGRCSNLLQPSSMPTLSTALSPESGEAEGMATKNTSLQHEGDNDRSPRQLYPSAPMLIVLLPPHHLDPCTQLQHAFLLGCHWLVQNSRGENMMLRLLCTL